MSKFQEINLSASELSLEQCLTFVRDASCGGEVVFVGTVRDQTKDKKVIRLEFEAYHKMAVQEMERIAVQALEKFEIRKIAIHHRTGSLEISEVPVIIAVSAAHRIAAFQACQYAIDTLKETVPIWKKEIFEDGEIWVAAHP